MVKRGGSGFGRQADKGNPFNEHLHPRTGTDHGEDELLLLSPVAVKIEWQRQHISKEIIEFGFEKAKQMGFSAVIVEGNPQNYRSRGFQTSADFGIIAGKSVGLPAPECLMVKELVAGALDRIQGVVEYTDYKCLR